MGKTGRTCRCSQFGPIATLYFQSPSKPITELLIRILAQNSQYFSTLKKRLGETGTIVPTELCMIRTSNSDSFYCRSRRSPRMSPLVTFTSSVFQYPPTHPHIYGVVHLAPAVCRFSSTDRGIYSLFHFLLAAYLPRKLIHVKHDSLSPFRTKKIFTQVDNTVSSNRSNLTTT